MSRSGRTARSPGRPARRHSCRLRNCANSKRRRPSAGSPSCRRAFGSRSRIITAPRLWFPNAAGAAPEKLEWKGSHLGAAVSPDGRFLVTSMQEPMLHGWRLVDRQHMRMSGYAARVTSLDWSPGGRWLATSGATQLILWPFQTKDGPMGKQPRLLAPSEHRIAVVACHPQQDIVAAGYGDGMVLLGAHRRRRRDFGQEARRCAGHGAGLERRRAVSGVGHGKRRGRRNRPGVKRR